MSVWHYIDKNGTRCEEQFSAEQCMADQQVLAEFQTLEGSVAEGEQPPPLAHNAPMVKKIELLPPNRSLHWLAELRRIGMVVGAKVKEVPNGTGKQTVKIVDQSNLGGSK